MTESWERGYVPPAPSFTWESLLCCSFNVPVCLSVCLSHSLSLVSCSIFSLAASSSKRNVTGLASVRPSCLPVPSAHIQRDSQGTSTRRGQRTFPSKYYQDGDTFKPVSYTHLTLPTILRV